MPQLYPRLALLATLLPLTAAAQHQLTAVGLNAGTGLMLPSLRTTELQVPPYTLSNQKSEDFIGSRAYQGGAYARFEHADKWWIVQPELQFTYGAASYVTATGPVSGSSYGGTEYYERVMRRGELALLGGARLSDAGAFLLGPVLAKNFTGAAPTAEHAENQPLLDALHDSPNDLQVLLRAALSANLGKLDLRFSYETGLTPYADKLRYKGESYQFGVNNHVLMFSLGVRLYHRY